MELINWLLHDRNYAFPKKIKLNENNSEKATEICRVPTWSTWVYCSFNHSPAEKLKAAWNQGPKRDKPILNFRDLQIPRNYFLDKPVRSVHFHTFTDASEFALSFVCYIRVEYYDQSIAVRFVVRKARVAPLTKMTIPNWNSKQPCLVLNLHNLLRKNKI